MMITKSISKKLILIFFLSIIYPQSHNHMQINLFANSDNLHFLHKNKGGLYTSNEIKNNIAFTHLIAPENIKWINMKVLWRLDKDKIDLYEFSNVLNFEKGALKIGSFHPEVLYENNKFSSGSMVFSNNARKINGISVTSKWYNFYDFFYYKAELFHGKFPKQYGYSGGPYLHYKSVLIKKQFNESSLGFSIQHAVQYGGYNKYNEKIPSSWKNYVDVFFVSAGDASQPGIDQTYKAGNGLGSFVLFFEKENTEIYFEHFFDDKSGVKTRNFGDGLLGMNFSSDKFNVNLELINTRKQSGNQHPPGVDSYYYHQVYEFGWSNKDMTIGNSFIYPNSNRKLVYNIALESIFRNFDVITRYAFAKVYIPYQDKNQNQPVENYTKIISTDNYILLGVNYKHKNKNITSFQFSKENDLTNFQVSYLMKF
jgi:hypothetical protein